MNCERLDLVCAASESASLEHSGPTQEEDTLSDSKSAQLSAKRKRTYRSCLDCRSSKSKCSGDRPICARCRRKQLECVYNAGAEPAWAQRFQSLSSNHDHSAAPFEHAIPSGRHDSADGSETFAVRGNEASPQDPDPENVVQPNSEESEQLSWYSSQRPGKAPNVNESQAVHSPSSQC